jgi:hypothetical protein
MEWDIPKLTPGSYLQRTSGRDQQAIMKPTSGLLITLPGRSNHRGEGLPGVRPHVKQGKGERDSLNGARTNV